MATVYVKSKSGEPLMPTTRCGHVRFLLKEGKVRVVERNPFTIQLLYETQEVTQPLWLGIDPGRTNIGLAAVREDGTAVMTAQMETRNKDIPKLMEARRTYRQAHRHFGRRTVRQRRAKAAHTEAADGVVERILPGCEKPILCQGIRNMEARFNNRSRPVGWLTPTANHLLLTHMNLIRKIQKFLPITDVVLEMNRFAFMALDNPKIQRWQYQQGPLYGLGSVKDAVFAQQNGKCLFCKNGIEHYHHVVPRRKNGSEALSNRAGLCEEHHVLVHKDPSWAEKLSVKKAGLNKKYHALSVLNQIIPYLTEQLADSFPGHVHVTTGKDTADFRTDHNIPKEHWLDAFCVACSVLSPAKVCIHKVQPYRIKQYRRHDRQACHQQMLDRKYFLDGKLVAVNRHKAMDQKKDSLEEYRRQLEEAHSVAYAEGIISRLQVKEHKPRYKDMVRHMPGSIFVCGSDISVMQRSHGRHNGLPDYYIGANTKRYLSHKCNFIQNNTGIRFC